MGSSRLPGKTLMNLRDNLSLLALVVDRFKSCTEVDEIVVATSTSTADDPIEDFCRKSKICYYRGSEENVLHRVVSAAKNFNPDSIVQMGADSAYLDFNLIDRLIRLFYSFETQYDYVCNDLSRGFPIGVYGHVVKFSALEKVALRDDLTTKEREDVVRYFWNHSDEFKLLNLAPNRSYQYPDLRLTIDYPADFALAQAILERTSSHLFTFSDVVDIYRSEPHLFDDVSALIQLSLANASQIKFDTIDWND